MTNKPKKRGFDLLRGDSKASAEARLPKAPSSQQLGRIQTKRLMRGPDGQMIDITVRLPILLVQFGMINQIVVQDHLEQEGYDVVLCDFLHELPQHLGQMEHPPRLIVLESLPVGQQKPFFMKSILPVLEASGHPHMMLGVKPAQQKLFSQWYPHPCIVEGDMDGLMKVVQRVVGPGRS